MHLAVAGAASGYELGVVGQCPACWSLVRTPLSLQHLTPVMVQALSALICTAEHLLYPLLQSAWAEPLRETVPQEFDVLVYSP